MRGLVFVVAALALLSSAPAETPSASSAIELPSPSAPRLEKRTGVIPLDGNIAQITTGQEFAFLDLPNAKMLLVDLWGNPSDAMVGVLGVLVPKAFDPLAADSWAVVITYEASGHVDDEDAASLDADALLKDMQEATEAANAERKKQGYGTITIVGWARPPSYDAVHKEVVWGERLKFEESDTETLNYRIRVLGRSGVLVMNAVAGIDQLPAVEKAEAGILAAASFLPGNTYAEYDASSDTAAEYGVAGLIAGGVAAKAGLFKGLLALLAAFWKVIAVGVVAVGAAIARVFGRKST